jgi:C4-dicarboxylate-specific signal transduction histidine kinase
MSSEPLPVTPAPRAGRRHSTLAFQLVVLLALFSVLPLFSSNLWGYLQSREYLTEHAFRNVRNVAALEASQTLEFVDNKRDLVPLIVAGNLDLFGLLRSLDAQTDPVIVSALERRLHKELVEKASEEPDAQEFFVLSPKGVLLGSTREDREPGSDASNEPCFNPGRQGPRVIGFEYAHDAPTLVVAAPVNDEFGTQWGVYCARFAFDLHRELEAGRAQQTPDGALYLLDARGRVVDSALDPGTGSSVIGTLLQRPGALVGGTAAWDRRYAVAPGEELIGAYSPVPTLGWGVLVEVPVSRALANLTRLKWQAIGVGSLLTALLVIAVTVAARRMSAPIKRLSEASLRVAGGNLGEAVPSDGPLEVATLAAAFNQMSLALRDSRQLLEQRVADATQELRQNQEFTELLINSIDARVVVVGLDLRIVKANRAALKAYGDGVVGRRCDEPFEGRLVCEAPPVLRTFESGQAVSSERSEQRGDAVDVVRLDTLPVTGPDHKVNVVLVVGRVVTAEKRLQAELLHHEKMAAFGLLAAGMAHEIGNPLASIAAQLRMNREANDPERVRQTFSVVEGEVDRVARLLRDLVTFARRKRDDVTLVQLNDVVEDVMRLIAHDPRARKVKIEKRPAPGLPGVRAKEDHLVQVLLNLSLNAIDAMAQGGTLTIETRAEPATVVVRISDTGPGIAPDVASRIFEPFFTTKPAGRGTGLGLFVSRDIVESLGGRLEVEQTSARGTTFAVRLPRDKPAAVSA